MIKPLRKRHLQVWIGLAFLLPAGIISAWLVIPQPVNDYLWQPASSIALPLVLKKFTTPDFSVSLLSNTDGSLLQLEWINQKALTVPSALIYRTNAGTESIGITAPSIGSTAHQTDIPDSSEIIGRIGPRGIYRFPLKKEGWETGVHFLLYDFIHHRLLNRINF